MLEWTEIKHSQYNI